MKQFIEEVIWTFMHRNRVGLLRHLVDGEAWKCFDARYFDFTLDPRNVRLGLVVDGFNTFMLMSASYNI